jgi:hypothetical protein
MAMSPFPRWFCHSGGLQRPNRTVTSAGTTTIGIDNASNTTSTTLSRIFRLIKVVYL